jgi:hypothetical protein
MYSKKHGARSAATEAFSTMLGEKLRKEEEAKEKVRVCVCIVRAPTNPCQNYNGGPILKTLCRLIPLAVSLIPRKSLKESPTKCGDITLLIVTLVL